MQVLLKSTVLLPLSFTPVPLVACNFKAETLMVFDRESWLAGWSRRGFLEQQDRYKYCIITPLVTSHRSAYRESDTYKPWLEVTVQGSGIKPLWYGAEERGRSSIACKEHEPGKSRFFDWCVEQVVRFLIHQLYDISSKLTNARGNRDPDHVSQVRRCN
ncbi:hypothetical protein B9Z19DRAFT_1082419 [Tuber borchii]|uniref:Uncharacterized protein n=1 Tax=Tuber borchii TaxID=42251 RepID=A0A2T6ZUQ2_TUBBO|nr:hypothetical protein B9Z19DRAFT_1082419 [Tuber borchii]